VGLVWGAGIMTAQWTYTLHLCIQKGAEDLEDHHWANGVIHDTHHVDVLVAFMLALQNREENGPLPTIGGTNLEVESPKQD
jgi:hypothetical protein